MLGKGLEMLEKGLGMLEKGPGKLERVLGILVSEATSIPAPPPDAHFCSKQARKGIRMLGFKCLE